jgi:hypothetical protein
MAYRKKQHSYLIVIILSFFVTISYSQKVDDSDLIMYKAPSPKYRDIVLQSHKGLPRFGILNNYIKPVKNSTNVHLKKYSHLRQDPATREKNKKIQLGYQNYFNMVSLHYLSNTFNDLDRERLTKTPSDNSTLKQQNSYAAQRYLAQLSRSICVEERCKNGFSGTNEFERLRNYKTFVNDNLDDLKKWSRTFFTNNNVVGYYVSRLGLGSQSYDFDKNGYWVFLSLNVNTTNNRSTYTFFEPKTHYENDLMNKSGSSPKRMRALQIFLPISLEKAEKFQLNNIRNLYLVKKIKMTYKEVVSGYKTLLKLTYHHESPLLEIYEDMALTKKIGTLSLDNLILKK